jgi:hypothetical protein
MLDTPAKQFPPQYFPAFFILMWLGITTLLGFLSGWFFLMSRYPNRKEQALLAVA